MEEEIIKKFLTGYGNGNGSGYGNGDGYGSGDGNGNGYGNGYGYGDGNGSGYGSGNGNGSGYGNGNGSGSGYGNGDGNGSGYGYGDGNGYGYGSGDGSGYGYGNGDGYGYGNGDGSGYGNGIRLLNYKGDRVYYIDGIPCTFVAIHGNCAEVHVIDTNSFQASRKYICRFNHVFAHGGTIKKAMQDAERKYYTSLDVEQSIGVFVEKFQHGVEYDNAEFYNWHTILTGSCDSGKDMWMQQKGISIDGKMTPEKFIELTRNAYGGDVITQLEEKFLVDG